MDKYDWEKELQGEASGVEETARPLYFAKRQGEYTIEDLEQFPEDFRCELIDGVIYDMTAPFVIHQILACDIRDRLKQYIQNHNGMCLTLVAPVDVHLQQDDSKTMVQPDVIVVCNPKMITKRRIEGAPDLVIEILSPSTKAKDQGIKLQKYMEAGVREYWLVDPEKKRVVVYIWDGSDSRENVAPALYTFDDCIPVGIFSGECQIDMRALCEEVAFLEELSENGASEVRETARPLYFAKRQGEYTIEDLEQFPEDFRCELIDGVIYDMTAPGSMHQMISFRLASLLDAFILQNKGQCKTGISAFDIYLFKDDNRTVVQPDVFVVCDRRKFSARGIEGAPDMIIEILSPSTRAKDQGIKLQKYMEAGVREYWLVDSEKKRVVVYIWDGVDAREAVAPKLYTFDDSIPVGIFHGECQIDMQVVYAEVAFLYEPSENGASEVRETAGPLYFAKRQGEYTVEDLEQFPEDYRCELIDGVIYDMTAPGSMHQYLSLPFVETLRQHVKKNKGECKVGQAPFDVYLFPNDNKTVLQPDIHVVCDRGKISERGIEGAPDLVMEILSPSTRAKDQGIKLQKYMEAGVREYWLVDPEKKRVVVYIWDGADAREIAAPALYTFDDSIPVGIFNGECQIDMHMVYAEVAFLDEPSENGASKVRETAMPLYFAKGQGEYTIEDYELFPEDFRCELIDGVIYDMTAPGSMHQMISSTLFRQIDAFIFANKGRCKANYAPFDVYLSKNDNRTVVQPDVFVVCDRSKFSARGIEGAPDLVMEILSPSTRAKDQGIKLQKYMEAGVREYWLVDPEKKRVVVYLWEDADARETVAPKLYTFDDSIPVGVFNGECQIDMRAVYAEVSFLEDEPRVGKAESL